MGGSDLIGNCPKETITISFDVHDASTQHSKLVDEPWILPMVGGRGKRVPIAR
jgi:hypothetical protein